MKKKKTIEINEDKEKDPIKESIKSKIIDAFATNLDQLILDEKDKAKDKGTSIFTKDIYTKIGIGKTTLQNYTKRYRDGGKIPKDVELFKIHDYFNVPYSYLFGETDVKNINHIEAGISLGLRDNAIDILSNLKRKSNNDNIENNYNSYIKLFLINDLIQDKNLLNALSSYVSILLGRKQLNKKYSGKNGFLPYTIDEGTLEMSKYIIMHNWLKRIDELVIDEEVPIKFKDCSEEIAKKYAGKMQEVIKEIDKQENR